MENGSPLSWTAASTSPDRLGGRESEMPGSGAPIQPNPSKLRLLIAAPAAMPIALRVLAIRFRAVHSMLAPFLACHQHLPGEARR